MSGRSCQFCGKPLWRIRRGSEGDFCSREHRNQYQLRRGLSQIAEADKAASIGRRREQPNIAALFRPAGAATVETRRLFAFKNPVTRRTTAVIAPPLRIRSDARVQAAGALRPRLSAHRGTAHAAAPVPLARGAFPLPARAARFRPAAGGVNALDAGMVSVPFRLLARGSASPHRLVSRLWQTSRPAVPPAAPVLRSYGLSSLRLTELRSNGWAAAGRPNQAPRIWFQGARSARVRPQLPVLGAAGSILGMPLAGHSNLRYDAIAPRPAKPRRDSQPREWVPQAFQYVALAERCLTVVGACRLPDPQTPYRIDVATRTGRRAKASARSHPALRPPRWDCLENLRPATGQENLAARGAKAYAAPKHSGSRRRMPGELKQPAPTPFLPPTPARRGEAGLAEPSAAQVPLRTLRPAPGMARAGVLPELGGATAAGMLRVLEARRSQLPLGVPGLGETPGHAVALHPAAGRGEFRVLEAPFPVLDPFFEPPQIDIHGAMTDFLETDAGPVLRLEEHFHTGLGSWQGDTHDWKVDVAGVRTGSLALYSPSLGLSDYGLEFLAKIENRSVGWVFRAADPENYFAVRMLAATSDGGSGELLRYAVIGGVREPAVSEPLAGRVRSRAAFTVQLLANGGDFSVAVDGETICRWSDSRLPAGGVGFQADGEDRARLYWVRLSSPPSRPPAAAPETRIGV